MIIPDSQLRSLAKLGMISPFIPDHINPASIDLTLGDSCVFIIERKEIHINNTLMIFPDSPVLVSTAEVICLPPTHAALVILKSSMGRLGLSMCNAGWVDPGFGGTLTVALYAIGAPVRIKVGQRFCQLVVHRMAGIPDKPYQGKYQHQNGPTMARGD